MAFAAGFSSVRQYNDTIQEVFAGTPSALRAARRRGKAPEPGVITLRLPYREPIDLSWTLDFLGAHAVPGLESYADGDVHTDPVGARWPGTGRDDSR